MSSLHSRCGAASMLGAPRPFVLGGTARVYERGRPFVIRHLALEIDLDTDKKSVAGVATIDVERVDATAAELCLDAVAFDIESAVFVGKKKTAIRYVYDGNTLRLPIAADVRTAKIRIAYRATPSRGLYFLEPDEHVQDRPRQVWTQNQDEDARHWFPCHDKPHVKMTFEIDVQVPCGWFALSNGALVKRDDKPKAKRWRYQWSMTESLPSYLITLVAGEFSEIDGGKAAGIPVTYLVPKGREAEGKRTFRRTPEMIEHFGKLIGVPYPWNKYAQVVVSDFIFGGMENTTATTMYEHILLDERAALDMTSDDIIAHELAHQWFGDYVTCRDWSHGWLNEGFATLFEHLDREHHLGQEELYYGLQDDFDAYLAEAHGRYRRPIVCQDYEAPIEIFDRHLYQKGGLVLFMLRRLLGDETFFAGVRVYLTRHARSIVETRDLMRALEDVSGRSLDQFFEQWVYRAGHPELEVKVEHEDKVLTITVKQVQKVDKETPCFVFPLSFDVSPARGKPMRHTRQIEKIWETIAIPCPERPSFVSIDPEFALLADVRLDVPADMLQRQLKSGPTARARWLAAPALAKRADPPSMAALGRTLADDDEFWGVRAKAAHALGDTRLGAAFELLRSNLKTKHPKVRRAVVQAMGQFRTPEAAQELKPIALKDRSYFVESEAARSLGKTRQTAAYETLIEILDRTAWGDIVRVGALDGLAALRDERAISHVLARTRYGTKNRGRRAAIVALARLTTDRKYREALEELLEDADPYLRIDVVRALVEMGDQKSRSVLARRLDREQDGRVRRRIREAFHEIGARGKEIQAELRDEIDKLKTEQAELASKMKKIEASLTKS
ncbi:MAG TPA: M1 family aminopeptidase [Polyangiaceae bacterium]|nr:M1 family aminopeptidase [Polyangiaceae bacterium]